MPSAGSRVVLVGFLASSFALNALPAIAADGWPDVGASGRPSWVPARVERRLRLLSALPAMHSAAQASAKKYFDSAGPGLAVGLVLDDGLYYSAGFGFADAARTKEPDENTVFRAGSLSKVITGTALLTLIDDSSRKMALTDPADANRYLPELKFVCPTFNQPCARGSQSLGIQLRHLVSHTSGLPNVMGDAHLAPWLSDLKKTWLLFPPGAFSAYSGVAVEGLGLIEQRISGKDYVQFVQDDLFAPLGMNRSSMDENTLPATTRAQKWMFSAGLPANTCEQNCNKDESACMKQAHSGPEREVCVKEKTQCVKDCPVLKPTWSFSKLGQPLPGDAQPMFRPAGSLATTVKDLAAFIAMWLSGTAPNVNGRPLLKPPTISSAGTSIFSASPAAPAPPAACAKGSSDANGFAYSACGTAFGFGVNWYVGTSPFLQHNGSIGVSGSETRVDQTRKMGATGLVSTEPYPTSTPQPAGLDRGFIDTVVFGLLTSGEAADAATDWAGRPLADGVARVLYLSGKAPTKDDLGAFTADFVAEHNLTSGNVVAFLDGWHDRIGVCRDFRVRDVRSATKIEAILACDKKKAWDTALTVGGAPSHRIAWTEVSSPSSSPAPGPQHQQCLNACSKEEGLCMATAHSAPERQVCIKEMTLCKKECK